MSSFHLIGDMLGDTTHPPTRKRARPGPKNTGRSGGAKARTTAGSGTSGGGFRSSFSAMIRKKPEVMVKISGFGKHKTGIKGNLDYISRDGELALETADGQLLKGKDDIKELATTWAADSSRKRLQQRDTMNLILSMPAGTSRDGVLNAARAFASKTFKENHDYVFVDHRDEKHSHVHLTVRMRGHDGKRLNPRKADLQHWRENFAEALRSQGIEAVATARRARGVVLKPVKQEIAHMRERAEQQRAGGEKAGQVRVDKLAVDEAFKDLRSPGAEPKPWEARIKERQQQIRSNYLQAADVLQRSTDRDERELAEDIRTFVKDMPPLTTQRHMLRHAIVSEYSKQSVRERDNDQRPR